MEDKVAKDEDYTHYEGSVTKVDKDGVQVLSSYVGPGEELVTGDDEKDSAKAKKSQPGKPSESNPEKKSGGAK